MRGKELRSQNNWPRLKNKKTVHSQIEATIQNGTSYSSVYNEHFVILMSFSLDSVTISTESKYGDLPSERHLQLNVQLNMVLLLILFALTTLLIFRSFALDSATVSNEDQFLPKKNENCSTGNAKDSRPTMIPNESIAKWITTQVAIRITSRRGRKPKPAK